MIVLTSLSTQPVVMVALVLVEPHNLGLIFNVVEVLNLVWGLLVSGGC
jgi:hypothetical protein